MLQGEWVYIGPPSLEFGFVIKKQADFVGGEDKVEDRVTSAREDRLIVNEAIRNPLMIARQIANDVLPHRRISDQTIRNRLHERDLSSRVRARVPMLSVAHRRARVGGKSMQKIA